MPDIVVAEELGWGVVSLDGCGEVTECEFGVEEQEHAEADDESDKEGCY